MLKGNFFSRLFFFNLEKVIIEGNKEPYQFDRLFGLPKKFTYRGDYPRFEAYVEKYKDAYKNDFFGLLLSYHNSYFYTGMLYYIVRFSLVLFQPIILKYFVAWIQDDGELWEGIAFGVVLLLIIVVQAQTSLAGYFEFEQATLIIKNTMRVSPFEV